MDYQRDEHCMHRIRYHFVWTPKRRKAVLKAEPALALAPLLLCRHRRERLE
jgi:REP element-mobilizing transposase RayT